MLIRLRALLVLALFTGGCLALLVGLVAIGSGLPPLDPSRLEVTLVTAGPVPVLAAWARVKGLDVLDIGSGGGLPGIPLAILGGCRSVTLLEPRERRALFLERVLIQLGIQGAVVKEATATAGSDARRRPATASSAGNHVMTPYRTEKTTNAMQTPTRRRRSSRTPGTRSRAGAMDRRMKRAANTSAIV